MAELAQEDKLMTVVVRDQHGRQWAGTVNKHGYRAKPRPDGRGGIKEPLMAFVSAPSPYGWTPPHPEFLPPSEVIHQTSGDLQNMRIDYEAWHGMAIDGAGEWDRALRILAGERYPSNPGEAIANPPADLLRAVGRRPFHTDFILAMRQGNRWALGLPSPVTGVRYSTPAWALPLLATVNSLHAPQRNPTMDAARFADEDALDAVIAAEDADLPDGPFDATFADVDDEGATGIREATRSHKKRRAAAEV